MPTCPACGAEHPAGARFCPSCGTALDQGCPRAARRSSRAPPSAARAAPASHRRPSSAARTVGSQRPAERKFVTVLFADLVGSTKLGEGLDAEKLKDVMDVYFKAMRGRSSAEGGTVEKFIGDAVMATFGAPVAHEDDPERALRAARAMLRRLTEVNGTLAGTYGVELAIRIGVNTGEVVAALAPRADETMVADDAVNVAARLAGRGGAGQVLVGQRTARASRGFRFEELEPLSVRGRDEPVRCVRPRRGG